MHKTRSSWMHFLSAAISIGFVVGVAHSRAIAGTPPAIPEDRFAALLLSGQYHELDERLAALQSRYRADPATENELHKAAYEFYRADRRMGPALDAWVAERPKSAEALLARGIYRTKMGWVARGTRRATDTKGTQFVGMVQWMKAAREDFTRALEVEASLVEADCYLIEVDMAMGEGNTREHFERALKTNPASFIAREFYLHSLLPRWGGSYEAMRAVMAEAKPFYSRMPSLAALEGRESADLGELAYYQKDYAKANQLLDASLAQGDFWFFNYTKGAVLYATRDYAGAIEQFTRALAQKPGYKLAWWMRAQAFKNLGKLPEALVNIDHTVAMEPQDDEAIAARGYILERMGDLTRALDAFRAASMIDPSDPAYKREIENVLAAMAAGPVPKKP